MSDQHTPEKCRRIFLEHVWSMIYYWEKESRATTVHDKLEGLAFSMLAAIDGSAAELPGFVLAPAPHPDDKAYHIANDEDYFAEAPTVECDIAGGLHELFHDIGREMGLHT